jgi:hypothetical protein
MADRVIVSISDNTDIRRGWRVRTFVLPAREWNAMGRTVDEQRFRTEAAARRYANKMAIAHNATLQG